MNTYQIVILIALIILILLSAFFSSAETALTTVSAIKIRSLVDSDHKGAKLVSKIHSNKAKMLSAILIGNNLVNIAASSLTTIFAQSVWGNFAVSISAGVLTLMVLIFGEITPKTIATYKALPLSLLYAPVIYFLMIILTPVIFIINALSNALLKLFGINTKIKDLHITEKELRTIVDFSHEAGVIEKEEKQIINNVFDFGDAVASDVMIPRVDMTMADLNSTYEELIRLFRDEKFTRIPIYRDTPDNVIGIVNMKDLLLYNPEANFDIHNFIRDAFYTYETKEVSSLLLEMKNSGVNIAIVIDEFGVTSGLITLEDLLEEIVGEIHDEYDTDEEDAFKETAKNKYLVDGQYKILDLNDKLNLNLHSDDYDSVGGLVIEKLDRFPDPGDKVIIDNITIRVIAMYKRRIEKVEITLM